MEVVLLILVIAIVALGWWISNLASRQGSAEERLAVLIARQDKAERDLHRLADSEGNTAEAFRQLQVELASVRNDIAELRERRRERPLPAEVAPVPETVEPSTTVAMPGAIITGATVAGVETVTAATSPPSAERRPAAAVAGEAHGQPQARRERPPTEALVPVAGPPAPLIEPTPTPSWTPPVPPVPAGPGFMERALRTLGLPPSTEEAGLSRAALEAWLEGRMLAVVGGIALLLGAVFFLSLAFSRGWITEEMRVAIGLLGGAVLLVLGEFAFNRLRGIVGPVLVAVGLAIVSLSLFAATRLYDLIPVEWALAGAFLAAVAAAVIAIRHDSQLVAAFGLVSVLAAPPVLGATPTLVTLLFVATTLIGTTAVALFRTWTWLPPLAFVLAAPQVASYVLGSPPAGEALAVVVGFWLLNVIAAGGEEIRHPTDRLRPVTVTLLLADAAYTLWAGFAVLGGELEAWRGTFLAVMALFYLGLAVFLLVRHGDRHPFGLVVAATGVAALTMAAPVQAGGPPVAIAWAAEAVALAWVAVLRRHPYSAAVSVLLGAMALGHLAAVEYPPTQIVEGFSRSVPFAGPEGITFAFMVAALLVAGLIVPVTWVRAVLAVIGGLVALYVFPFELSGPALVAGWAALAVAGVVLFVRVVAPRVPADFQEDRTAIFALAEPIATPVAVGVAALSSVVLPLFATTALIAGVAVLGHLAWIDYPLTMILEGTPHDVPFVGLPGLSFAIVLVALAAIGLLVPIPWIRVCVVALGGLVALYVFPFELSGPALVWAWAGLAVGAVIVEAWVIASRVGPAFSEPTFVGPTFASLVRPGVLAVGVLVGLAMLAHLLVLDFPPVDLGKVVLSTPPFVGPEGLSLAAVLATLAVTAWVLGARWLRLGAVGIGLALLVYTVTFEITQPAVTVAWAVLLLAGLLVVRRLAPVELVPSSTGTAAESIGERLPYAAVGLALAFLVLRSIVLADPVMLVRHLTGSEPLPSTPFFDERTFVLLVLAATIAVAGWVWGGVAPRLWGGVTAALVIAWLLPFEVPAGYVVAGWSALALAALALLRVLVPGLPMARELLGGTALLLLGLGMLVAVAIVAPPDRLVVDAFTTVPRWGLLTEASVALGSLTIALLVGAILHRNEQLSRPVLAVGGVTFVYLCSVAVVDAFQVQVGSRQLEDLQKEAQVALSVLWSILGGVFFAAGLLLRRPPVRLFGLALLGLATAKVFLVDLAALDVAYRVLSLVALGVLLLISAVVYQRMQHPHGPTAPRHT